MKKLIYAEDLLVIYEDCKACGKNLSIPIDVIIQNIKDAPIACNIEVMCKQIEKALDYNSGYPYCSEYDYAYGEAMAEAKKIVTDIVRKGGAEWIEAEEGEQE
jgi:hypothetical protein